MSTTNIDRVTTIQRVANRTGKTVIHDILLSNVLQLVTQKIPNALNNKKVQVFLPSFIYLLKDKPEYQQYIEPYKKKMKYTGKSLHGKFIMNVRISMLRDIEKLRLKSKVLDNCCLIYSLWERLQGGRRIQAIPVKDSRVRDRHYKFTHIRPRRLYGTSTSNRYN